MPDLLYLALWLLALEAIGLATLPLAQRLFAPLADRGAAFARPLGLVVVGYAIWLLGSIGLLRLTGATVFVAVAVFAAFAWLGSPTRRRDAVALLRRNRLLWVGEAVFVVAFLAMAWLRAYNPDISATEKPMDFLFLNAVARGDQLPPEDPWLAGYSISYYYFGYYLFGLLSKLTAVPTNYGFNLALAALFGMLMSGSFSLGANLAALGGLGDRTGRPAGPGRWLAPVAGLLAAAMVGVCANLEGVLEVMKRRGLGSPELFNRFAVNGLTAGPEDFTSWWWWRASRVISDINPRTGARGETINEFPFFSYLLGDLHPHVMAAPVFLAVAALGLTLLARDEPLDREWLRRHRVVALLGALLVGSLGFLNSWDLPAAALLLAAARLVWGVQRGEGVRAFGQAVVLAVAVMVVSFVLFLPFWAGYRGQAIGLGVVEIRTRLPQFALFWGLFLFLAGTLALTALIRAAGALGPAGRRTVGIPVAAGAVAVLLAAVAGAPVLGSLLLWLGLLAGAAFSRAPASTPQRPEWSAGWSWALTLTGVGAVLIALCEVVFAADVFGSRLNTVFKLYYQAWPLLACASAYAVVYVGQALWQSASAPVRLAVAPAWAAVAALLFVGTLAYPATAPAAKTNRFANAPTLDGMRWIANIHPSDYDGLMWLRREVAGTPVTIEGYKDAAYDYPGRVGAYTGLPGLMGWQNHESQWRGNQPVFARRAADAEAIYRAADPVTLPSLLQSYGVKYLFYGDIERQLYGDLDAVRRQRFADLLGVAYDGNGVTIFGPGLRGSATASLPGR